MNARQWTHDELAADLLDARHLAGEIAMERLRVGPGYTSEGIQLDVVSMRPSWTDPRYTGYEVKISRSDFLADLRAEKWRKYLGSVERLYFAVPAKMVEAAEVPAECGLLWRHETIWRARRIAPPVKMEAGEQAVFLTAMLLRFNPAPWDATAQLRGRVLAVVTDRPRGR